MRKLLLLLLTTFICSTVIAQNDVTKFLGIPVDGSKTDMLRQLKAKGFKTHPYDNDVLQGEFNGRDVNVYVATTGNKVSRIMLTDENYCGETDIKIRFNTLCKQFKNNPNYITLEDYTISDDENFANNLKYKDKRYEAIFYQKPDESKLTEEYIQEQMLSILAKKYSQEELENPTDEIKKDIQETAFEFAFDMFSMKPVWFMISKGEGLNYGTYYISMFYDNEYNRANGQDL